MKNSVFALVPQEAYRPYVKTVGSGEADWIAKFIFISEKADLLSYCVCVLASLGAAEGLVACLLSHNC